MPKGRHDLSFSGAFESKLRHLLPAFECVLMGSVLWLIAFNRTHCDQDHIGSGIQRDSFLPLAAGNVAELNQRLRFLGNNKQLKETWGLG